MPIRNSRARAAFLLLALPVRDYLFDLVSIYAK
jgi:hypothetical protein